MSHDPWTDLRIRADEVRKTIERDLGVRSPGALAEAPEGKGLFAIAAFPYAKDLRQPPADIARRAARTEAPAPFVPLVAEGPYVNLVADPPAFATHVLSSVATMGESYGRSPRRSERVLLEHTSVNPTGPIHVGRARNPIYGDSLARVLDLAGYDLTREYLVNDVGKQMVLQYWAAKHLKPEDVPPPDVDKEDFRLVKYYQKATALLEAKPELNEEVIGLIQQFERGDATLTRGIRAVSERVLGGILQTLSRIDVTYDSFFWESDLILDGSVQAVIERLKPLSRAEDGAHYLDLKAFGLEGDAAKYFFVTRHGTSLYTTRDIAYHLNKKTRCDVAINVLGEDQKLSFQRLKAAFQLMGIDWTPETIFYAFVGLPEGRMSTRKGRVVNLDDLIDEAVERAYLEVSKRRADLPEEKKRAIAEIVGVGAVRFNIVRVQAEKRILFRWEEALNFEGTSGPFLQYAHARACGILDKADSTVKGDPARLVHPAEQRLLRWTAKFPSTIREAAETRRVHAVGSFVSEFASVFNEFYRDCPVLSAEPSLRQARLTLVDVARVVLQNGLGCLGLKAPREM
ncbi:MAG: arginine--tRNA ligase [Euryarchaeota archaeon RBG_16_68_13]|nr:MAG: arginine--tRNA ligase [Euryarchaeota archaeon RBG_16_68_13]